MNLEKLFDTDDRSAMERYLISSLHRVLLHYALWFRETIHQLGEPDAFRIEEQVWDQVWSNHLNRLGKTAGFEVEDGIPAWVKNLSRDKLLELITAVAVNWLATDGIWFQAVETQSGMFEAKMANDTCWGRFSPLEVREIKRILNLPEQGGIEALKTALAYRLYARLNVMTLVDEPDGSLTLYVNDCRVQSARKRKGLEDYPCQSVGTIEYSYFAKSVDPRIRTERIGCPPDPHPEDWYCAWRFRVDE